MLVLSLALSTHLLKQIIRLVGSNFIVDVSSSSGTKIVTSNPFDVLNMVEKDIRVTPSDSVNSKYDDVNVRNSKDVKYDNEDNNSENDLEEDSNETTSFMASKSSNFKGYKLFKKRRWNGEEEFL
ncbi:hypothetical protein Tco_0484150 [Tanacetum coccineum]